MNASIVVAGLTKSYGKHVGIESLDLSIEPGEVMGFLGTNGAGKTTTLRCLVGLLKPSAGTVRVLGLDPVREHNNLMPDIGYLPGELRLYLDLTGRQHLELLGDLQNARSDDRERLCERLGLTSKDLDRPIRDYSRGMKQKVGLVQAFQHKPRVAFLDEPTEGLDPLVQQAFFEMIAEASAGGCTILLSSHVMSEVQQACNRVAIVKSGHLVTVDSVESLRSARSRTVRVTFAGDVDRSSIATHDSWNSAWNEQVLTLSLEPGEVVDALRTLLSFAVVDVTVEEAGLDEAVLALYRDKDAS